MFAVALVGMILRNAAMKTKNTPLATSNSTHLFRALSGFNIAGNLQVRH
jgi:hypothetical protein